MKVKTNSTGWDRPTAAAAFTAMHPREELELWQQLRDQTARVADANGWSKAEVSRRTDVPNSTFSQWFSGQYEGTLANVNERISQWLATVTYNADVAEAIPASPGFLRLRSSIEIFETLVWAQVCPDLVLITCSAGIGKTEACRQFEETRPHVYHATVSENTKTVHGMLVELAAELGVNEHNPARLARAIGNKVRRMGSGTLLIVDEGQHLNDEALNQLRHFVDVYKCGVAVVGNKEVYDRFGKSRRGPSYDQLKSRIGKRLQIEKPYPEDLAAIIASWGITEERSVQLLSGIGMKGGAFRQIDKTMKLAGMFAMGKSEEITFKHIQSAWKNRNVEDIA